MPPLIRNVKLSHEAEQAIACALENTREEREAVLARAKKAGDDQRRDLACITDNSLKNSAIRASRLGQ